MQYFRSPSPLSLVLPIILALFTACGDDSDDNVDSTDEDRVDGGPVDGGPTDDDTTDQDGGDGDADVGDSGGDAGDIDNGDGDGEPPTDVDPVIYGLDARPSQDECTAFTRPPVTDEVQFVDRFPNVRFSTPVSITQRPNDNTRFWVNERAGRIYSFPNEPTATNAQRVLALDLTDVLTTRYDCATASLTFAPDFATSGVAYVAYCHRFDDPSYTWPRIQARMSRFRSTDGGLHFDRDSEQVIVAINYVVGADDATDGYTRGCNHSEADAGLHAGNAAHFGTDGYLYWSVGDGGPQGHCGGKQGQHLSSLRGKMLRMDVSDLLKEIDPSLLAYNEGVQYTAVDIPPTNPFFGPDPNPVDNIQNGIVQPLVYASGFRNPWQWSFDPADGKIWLGDVGNGTWEEINRDVQSGGNYGWGFFEGYYCANSWGSNEYPDDGVTPVVGACTTFANQVKWPMLAYRHGASYDVTDPPPSTPPEFRIPDTMYGRAVSGGVVYRGTAIPTHTGSYFFADSSTARVWEVRNVDDISTDTGVACDSSATCGAGLVCKSQELPYEDPDGPGVGVNGYDPNIVGPPTPAGRCTADYALVQAGLPVASFARDQNNEIYAVLLNGSIRMLRAVAPSGGTGGPPELLSQTNCFQVDATTSAVTEPVDDLVPFQPSAELWSDGAAKRRWLTIPDGSEITLNADGDFDFPIGSVLVKEFSLAGQRVETRFFVRQVEDGRWAAYTYEWNDEQTDAALVPENGASRAWGTQVWQYPGRQQCFECHNTVAGTTLGPETAQLNHDLEYAATGRTANQMQTLEHIGIVDTAADPAPWANLAAIADTTRTVEERARAYLHSNCSNCHRPNGPTFTEPDMRYSVAFADMKICNAPPNISAMEDEINGPNTLLTPGDPEHSQVYRRHATTNAAYRMPPLATSIPHTAALEVLEDWITSITVCE